MCGRYAITLPKEAMIDLFDLAEAPEVSPRYNVAPSQAIPVIAIGADETRKCVMMRWGLHPRWMKEPPGAKSMINARSETAAEKPFFRDAFKKRRCLIPASAFYEWKRDGETKSPHAIHRVDGAPLVFAGLWERWQGEAGDVLTAAVLTTSANATMAQIHDRMPCLIEKRDFAFWLDPGAPREALEWMLAPAKDDVLDLYPVSRAVNSARSEGAALLERV